MGTADVVVCSKGLIVANEAYMNFEESTHKSDWLFSPERLVGGC